MTKKRFTKQEVYDGINRYRINESNFIVEILDDGIPMHYSTIVNRLNEQHKTITRLENENEQLKDFIRKELQLQMLRLYNYFENYFEDTMNPNAFSEMWDNVKEDEKWEKRRYNG